MCKVMDCITVKVFYLAKSCFLKKNYNLQQHLEHQMCFKEPHFKNKLTNDFKDKYLRYICDIFVMSALWVCSDIL